MMLEKQIEAKAVKWAKSNSWLTYKFTSPNKRGVPDRIFIKSGCLIFIEFKAERGKLTKLQQREINILKKEGMLVFVVYSFDEFLKVITNVKT